jgi:hypothetical protein
VKMGKAQVPVRSHRPMVDGGLGLMISPRMRPTRVPG